MGTPKGPVKSRAFIPQTLCECIIFSRTGWRNIISRTRYYRGDRPEYLDERPHGAARLALVDAGARVGGFAHALIQAERAAGRRRSAKAA